MNGKIITATIATFACVMLAFSTLALAVGTEGDVYETEFTSEWATTAPIQDGIIEEGEYSEDAMVNIDFTTDVPDRNDTITIYVMNDADWLYVGVDVLPDNTSTLNDYCILYFDEDANGIYDQYAPVEEGYYMVYMANVSDGVTEILAPFAESNQGFLFFADFSTTYNDEDVDHMVYEFKIPLSNFKNEELELGDTIAMFAEGEVSTAWAYPIDANSTDASIWAEITLAESPTIAPVDEERTAQDYGVIMMGFGAIIATVFTLFYKETELKWIGDGNMRAYLGAKIAVAVLLILGLLQYYYDWLGTIGLT